MLSNIKQRLGRGDEQGFTLIELMVVVLIIAILLAIAIPTFLGAKSSANARAAQSNDRNALTAEQTVYTNGQVFSADNSSGGVLYTAEPNLVWSTTAPSSTSQANTVGVFLGASDGTPLTTGDTVFLEAYGKDGNCYVIQQTNAPGFTGAATSYAVESGPCTAPAANTKPAAPNTTALPDTGSAHKETAGSFPGTFYPTW